MTETDTSPKTLAIDDMRRAILTQERAPGSDLDETRLSARYGLSRTPLREILRQLAGEGYVTLSAHRGARVSDMSHRTLREFFQAAPMIYAAVMRLAALNAGRAEITALRQAQDDFRRALRHGDPARITLADNRFHALCGDMAHNLFLLPSYRRLLIDHARIGVTFFRPRDTSMAASLTLADRQHEEMIAAIEAGDGDRAAALAQDHWTLSRGQIESYVMPGALDVPLGEPAGPPPRPREA